MNVNDIIGFIFLGIFVTFSIFVFILAIRFDYLFKKRRKEYIEQLNEHDKSVIFDYEKKIYVTYKEVLKSERRK